MKPEEAKNALQKQKSEEDKKSSLDAFKFDGKAVKTGLLDSGGSVNNKSYDKVNTSLSNAKSSVADDSAASQPQKKIGGIASVDNKQVMQNQKELIATLKKVLKNSELMLIVNSLREFKSAKSGSQELGKVFSNIRKAMFQSQENPNETDSRFNQKIDCIKTLQSIVPFKLRPEFSEFFKPLLDKAI